MAKVQRYILLFAIFAGIAYGAISRGTAAVSVEYKGANPPEIIAATFTSEWCAACKVLEPKLANVIPEFSEAPVQFVELSFTFGETQELAKRARDLNFLEAYEQVNGATGFTLIIDAETGEVIDAITMSHSKKAMRAIIAHAIAIAERAE